MVLETKVYVEHPDLALSHTIRSLNCVDVGVVSDAGTDPEHDVYYFWIESDDFELVNTTLEEDHTIGDFTALVNSGNRRTYRIEYSDDANLITPGIVDVSGLTLEARSYLSGWQLHLELRNHDAFLELNEYANEAGIKLEILELQHRDSPIEKDDPDLTESQRAALVGAFIHGYFDDPRTVTQEELADILGISSSALSGRLRRGAAQLIGSFLLEDEARTVLDNET